MDDLDRKQVEDCNLLAVANRHDGCGEVFTPIASDFVILAMLRECGALFEASARAALRAEIEWLADYARRWRNEYPIALPDDESDDARIAALLTRCSGKP